MPSTTLLTSSLHYGVVARSYPLRGKVLRGYLDAAGTANGVGNGNPNAEFSPLVSAIALASEGRTARVAWGFSNGEVAVTVANRAMDEARPSSAQHVRCRLDECHEGTVRDIAWTSTECPTAFVTGATDGRMKLWDAKRVNCLWTSEKSPSLIADPCIKVAIDSAHGVVVGVMESNEIVVWSGVNSCVSDEQGKVAHSDHPHKVCISRTRNNGVSVPSNEVHPSRELSELRLTFSRNGQLSILTSHKNECYFERIIVELSTAAVEYVAFGDTSSGYITSLNPVFATQDEESSFVIVGDKLGCISIFDWDARPDPVKGTVLPYQKFEAHEDGAVTALAWNPIVLISGSSGGSLKVWDSISFALLRTFASSAPRPAPNVEHDGVLQILMERDVLLASIGSKVTAFHAGRVEDKAHGKGKQAKAARHSGLAKWQQQLEMHHDIAESRRDLEEEQAYMRRAFGREREQRSTLEHLGLSEVEAVEYVLMLSRDEEERRRESLASASSDAAYIDGVFMDDFDDAQMPVSGSDASLTNDSNLASSSRTRSLPGRDTSSVTASGHSLGPTLPAPMNRKVCVSPRPVPEPMAAGFSASPSSGSVSSSFNTQGFTSVPPPSDPDQFPAISRTPSSAGVSVPSSPYSPDATHFSASGSGSPSSYRSAWSIPLRSRHSSRSASFHTNTSSSIGDVSDHMAPDNVVWSTTGPSLIAAGFGRQTSNGVQAPLHEDQEDEELKFAIELSLAEARSRGENV
ncbi:uncharacterized protein LAESUDRAFT_656559 [Laetiporus sulphureus 93-53]|uniref:WD40 repeat-like protein n=1 Tax=Laetiporus sulphureus 93-53 TaxID=1314785 RepID=A0A165DK93_9APHY|nr:uncharacterized protein LAESUDRAFT_656559 [Laetiporus sulphureus 93-53]KZT05066.1 hypothetical protein LAESUDRAFT_656559 [Laetiporus sulphureus 93-53]